MFTPGPLPEPVEFRGVKLGVPVCEDVWFPEVTRHLASRGADMLLVPNGSPFEVDKLGERLALLRRRTAEARRPIVYVNQVGGQDELVFDGGSFVLNSDGQLALVLPSWVESVAVTEWQRDGDRYRCAGKHDATPEPRLSTIYNAMMVGLRDYVEKNGFRGIVLGLSGGIDSALTAVVAVDEIGRAHV